MKFSILIITIAVTKMAIGTSIWNFFKSNVFSSCGLSTFSIQSVKVDRTMFKNATGRLFPNLKFIVANNTVNITNHLLTPTLYEVEIDHLDKFTENFYNFPTIFYCFGFLGTSGIRLSDYLTTETVSTKSTYFQLYFTFVWRQTLEFYVEQNYPEVIPPGKKLQISRNIVLLDWSSYNTSKYFTSIIKNMIGISPYVGNKIYEMTNSGNPLSLTMWQFIGHSLGAHMAGLISRRVKESSGGKTIVPRVTGLDPAGPFLNYSISELFIAHLQKTDGKTFILYIISEIQIFCVTFGSCFCRCNSH